MISRPTRRAPLLALAAVTLFAGACGGGADGDIAEPGTDNGGGAASARLSGTLNASGSSFQASLQEACIQGFEEEQPNVTVNYGAGGSGKGKQDLADGVVDFAGSDSLVKPEEMAKYTNGVMYVPLAAAPINVTYNLSEVKTLKLSPDTIARIFSRQVKTWNDASIKADNPGVALPSTPITVVHRSDSSGTTEQFTKFLAAAAPDVWTIKAGSTVEWPTDTQAGNGNQGVATAVKATAGAVGYVDLSDAKASGLSSAQVKNKAGKFVEPTTAAASAAMSSATINADLTFNPLFTEGDAAYPITSPTWVLVPKTSPKADLLKAYLGYVVDGCQDLAEEVDFAKLPASLAEKAKTTVDSITTGGADAPTGSGAGATTTTAKP